MITNVQGRQEEGRKNRNRNGQKEMVKAGIEILGELIKKSQLSPAFVTIQEKIHKF